MNDSSLFIAVSIHSINLFRYCPSITFQVFSFFISYYMSLPLMWYSDEVAPPITFESSVAWAVDEFLLLIYIRIS